MTLKIAIVLNSAWNAYNFRKGLIKHLLNEGDEVIVIAPADEWVKELESWGTKFLAISLKSTGLNPIEDWRYRRALGTILKKERPDVVLGFTIKPNIYGSLAAHSLRIPIICNVSGLGTTFLWKGWVKQVAISLYNRAFRKTNFIFFQNSEDRELFLSLVDVDQSRVGTLPGSGINLAEFRADPPKFQKPLSFLMIARLIVEKGIIEYMQAAEIVHRTNPDVRFQLIGKYDPEHKRSISSSDFENLLAGSVEYLGEEDAIQAVIAKADVVVLPSYREGTPRTLLEAAAMNRPLITTDVPGCREVVQDGVNGFLCKVMDASHLAQKMNLFIAMNTGEQQKMGVASRKWVEARFDENIVIGQYINKIKELVC